MNEEKKHPIELLKEYVKVSGIMLTLRYIVEREEWFGVIHFTKDAVDKKEFIEPVDSYRESLDDLSEDLMKKAAKRLNKAKDA